VKAMKKQKNFKFSEETIRKLEEIEKLTLLKSNNIVELAIEKYHELILESGYDINKLKLKEKM
jgi:hypothetical protein